MLPSDFSTGDAAALGTLLVAWIGYHLLMDRYMMRRRGINYLMRRARIRWMTEMLGREQRNADALLIGHALHSVTYFASTTVLLMAGIAGAFAAVETTHHTLARIALVAPQSLALLQLKLLILLGCFIYAFMQFTWSLRQCNYSVALMGGAPPAGAPAAERARYAEALGDLLTLALHRFVVGVRLYYFAIAVLAWLVSPWASIAITAAIIAMLVQRQLFSRALGSIARMEPPHP